MITYSSRRQYEGVEFGEYLDTPGFSHSFLKHQQSGIAKQFDPTAKMQLGSLVDAILTEPSKADMFDIQYNIAKDIAAAIKKDFPFIEHLKKQVSLTAIAEYKGFQLPVKGRIDYLLEKRAVIDLKVTHEKNIHAAIAFFGYQNPLWNYCKMAGVDKAYLFIYCVPLKKTFNIFVDCSQPTNKFWEDNIIQFGKV